MFVVTSPDAERTMNTFLGVSSFLSPEHIHEQSIIELVLMCIWKAYLVASPKGLEAMKEAKKIAEKNKVFNRTYFFGPKYGKVFFKCRWKKLVGASVDLLSG
ncbi:MAG: hypothetical protein U5K54_27655 [Cytophagales bacterium]|nr:hypothetical protein [Cytophagales bacterium]